jgi:hypothetical protein
MTPAKEKPDKQAQENMQAEEKMQAEQKKQAEERNRLNVGSVVLFGTTLETHRPNVRFSSRYWG